MDDLPHVPTNEPSGESGKDPAMQGAEDSAEAQIPKLTDGLHAESSPEIFVSAPEANPGANAIPTGIPAPEAIPESTFASLAESGGAPAQAASAQDADAIVVPSFTYVGAETPRQRTLRNNLFTLLGLSLASFILTAWVLVRVESPFGMFASGPRDVVSAQLRALDRGEMRASYDLFSEHYRKQVTFDQWRQLVVTHWRLFHAEILGAEPMEQSGQRVTMEIHLRGADEKPYVARFTLIRAQGRWWVDDLHWANEPDERDLRRT